MSDPSTLEGQIFDLPETVLEGPVVSPVPPETAWEPQTESPMAARSPRTGRKSFGWLKSLRRAVKTLRSSSAPSVPTGPRKRAAFGRKVAGASRRGVLSYGRFLDTALLRLDQVASVCTVLAVLAAGGSYIAFRPSAEQLVIGLAIGIVVLAALLLPLVYRIYVWRERGTFLATVGIAFIAALLLAVTYGAIAYLPQHTSGMAFVAVPVLTYADLMGKKLQKREAAKQKADALAQAEALADAREAKVRAEIQPLLEQVQSTLAAASAVQDKANTGLGQLVQVAPHINDTVKAVGELVHASETHLAGVIVKEKEVNAIIEERAEGKFRAIEPGRTQQLELRYHAAHEQALQNAVAANQQTNDGEIALRDQKVAELDGHVRQLSEELERLQHEQRLLQQQLAEEQCVTRELTEENNRLQRGQQGTASPVITIQAVCE